MTRTRSLIATSLLCTLGCADDPEPLQVRLLPEAPTTTDTLVAELAGPPGWSATGFDWQVDGEGVDVVAAQIPSERTQRDQVWTVTVRGTSGGATSEGRASVTILNSPPTAEVHLEPDAPRSNEPIEAFVIPEDPDGDPVTTALVWRLDDAEQAETSTTFPPAGRRGQVLRVDVTPNDGQVDGPVAQAEVTLRNALPEVVAAQIVEPVSRAAAAEASVEAADHDEDEVELTYSWQVDGSPAGSSATLAPDAYARGQTLLLTLTPYDGREDGAAFTTAPVVVDNAVPTLSGATISPSEPTRLTGATCAGQGWFDADDDPEGVRFTWLLDGTSQGPPSSVGFIDGDALTKGQTLVCEAIPDDGLDLGLPVMSDPVVVRNSPPTVAGVRLDPEQPTTASEVGFVPEDPADPDDDPISFVVAWYVNDALVSDAPTLHADLFSQGDLVRVEITPDDGEALGMMVSSDAVEAANGKPQLTGLTLLPAAPRVDDTLLIDFEATDPDGDPITIRITWLIDGQVVKDGEDPELQPGDHTRGDEIVVEIRADDGIAGETTATAGPVVVVNTPPVVLSASVSPAEPTRLTGATCVPGEWFDADGDAPGYHYAWSVNGDPLAHTGSELPGALFERDDVITCIVTPDDGLDEGALVVADPVFVGNAPPQVTTLSISPDPANVTDVLTASFTATDADDDPIEAQVQWRVNDADVSDEPSLAAPDFQRGDVVSVVLILSDGIDEVQAGPVSRTVANAPPVMVSVSIAPDDPRSSDAIQAAATATDPDDDPVTLSYRWRADGTVIHNSAADPTLPSGLVQRGQTLTVEVTPNDGTGGPNASGAAIVSAGVVLRNGLPSAPSVAILPLQPSSGNDDLRCTLLSPSVDPDGDPITYTLSWARNGSAYPSGGLQGPSTHTLTNDTVPAADAPLGTSWTCTMTPHDGIESGASAVASVVVVNPAIGKLRSREDATCGLTPTGQQRCWGYDQTGLHTPTTTAFVAHDVGYGARCGITPAGSISCVTASGSPLATPPSGTDFVDLRLGAFHGCARRSSGELSCWGDPTSGTTSPPPGPWLDVGAGFFFTCGLHSSGELSCWGFLGEGSPLSPPSGTFSRLATGPRYACAIEASGAVQCWGEDAPASVPEGTFVEVYAGPLHACALAASGEATCWGDDTAGQSSPPTGARWRSLALGTEHTCGVTQDGALSCFGSDDLWQRATPGANLSLVTLGDAHACGVDPDTTAPVCWGNNSDGQAEPPPDVVGVTSIAIGSAHTCAVAFGNQVICWGDASKGQHDAPDDTYLRVDARNDVTCGITSTNAVRCWGTSTHGHLTPPSGDFSEVRVGGPFACARRMGGTITCWGTDNSGVITSAPTGPFTSLTAGNFFACATRSNNTVACWGANTFNEALPPTGLEAVQLAAGTRHTCAREPGGTLTCFGSSAQRRLAAPAGTWQHISARTNSTCAVRSDGQLRCWGAYVR